MFALHQALQDQALQDQALQDREPGGLRILLVEDNPVNQVLAARLLQKRRHSTTVAGNGQEALAVESETFDLVLMDMQLPVMNGLKASAAIRERESRNGGHMPIIAMTANAMHGDRERCLEAGMDDYISKPIEPATFFDVIDKVMRRIR